MGRRINHEVTRNGTKHSTILRVRALRKSYPLPGGDVLVVLRDVSFDVGAGELLALMGASGAGKSTLLHVVGGLDEADSGSVRVREVEVLHERAAQLAAWRNRELGFVFQFHHLLPDLTALENVALPLLIARAQGRKAQRAALELLTAVGLQARAAHRTGELSGGEQQRVAIARALVMRPALVLADEPTGNLDAQTGASVAALLARLCRERGAAVLVATHNEQLAHACDRVLRLQDGRIEEGNRQEAKVKESTGATGALFSSGL